MNALKSVSVTERDIVKGFISYDDVLAAGKDALISKPIYGSSRAKQKPTKLNILIVNDLRSEIRGARDRGASLAWIRRTIENATGIRVSNTSLVKWALLFEDGK